MLSDDTEHAVFVAQAWLACPADPDAFQCALAWRLRWWLVGAPAGIGLATLRAILRLWAGVPPHKSGVNSAGNGPGMRSAVLGAVLAAHPGRRREFVRASTRLTHTHPHAETAAQAVAAAAASALQGQEGEAWLQARRQLPTDHQWKRILDGMADALEVRLEVPEFAARLGLERGVTGYSYHSVPVALYAWLRHSGNYRVALEAALNCGGDTDTVGAILGGVMGAGVGVDGIPVDWRDQLWDWPRSRAYLLRVAGRLADRVETGRSDGPVPCFWPGLLPRNALFMAAVLTHGFRRLLPPY